MTFYYLHNRKVSMEIHLNINPSKYTTDKVKAIGVELDLIDIRNLIALPMGTQSVILKRIRDACITKSESE